MKQSKPLTTQSLTELSSQALHRLSRYAVVGFLLLLAGVYGFVLVRISALSDAQPDDAAISAQVRASATPHVNPAVVQQLQDLQDHSVSIKTLFDQARNNPFQE